MPHDTGLLNKKGKFSKGFSHTLPIQTIIKYLAPVNVPMWNNYSIRTIEYNITCSMQVLHLQGIHTYNTISKNQRGTVIVLLCFWVWLPVLLPARDSYRAFMSCNIHAVIWYWDIWTGTPPVCHIQRGGGFLFNTPHTNRNMSWPSVTQTNTLHETWEKQTDRHVRERNGHRKITSERARTVAC